MDATTLFNRNNAPAVNPNMVNGKTVDIAQTVRGSDFYYAICAVMGTVALGVIGASYAKPRTDRIFFYITAAINMTACIAYFAMGSNLGWTPIDVEWQRTEAIVAGRNRQIMYVRYIDWVITTPLLLMDLLLTAGMPWPTIIWTIFLDEVMIVTGLVGALVRTRYKFGFYAFGCAAMLAIFYELAGSGRKHARALGSDVYRVYMGCGVVTLFIWLLYPVAWGVCEGGNVIAPDSEAVFYGVLDFCAKPVFSILLILGHWSINPERMGLRISEFGNPAQPGVHGEKEHTTGSGHETGGSATNGASTGIDGADGVQHRSGITGEEPGHTFPHEHTTEGGYPA